MNYNANFADGIPLTIVVSVIFSTRIEQRYFFATASTS